MNSKPRLGGIALLYFLYACSSSGSKESPASQDTLTTNIPDSIPVSQPVVISEAEVSALEGKVNEQFEKVYKDIVDTTNYIKVILFDNYNEYEGQDEGWEAELYFDKTFTLRFFKEIHVTGVDGANDISEYIIDNNTILWGRVKFPYYESDRNEKTIIQWGDQSKVIQSKISRFDETIYEIMNDAYKTEQFKDVEAHLSSITNVLHDGEMQRETAYSFSFIIIKEKDNSDLIDSTKVIIPKIIYKHFKNMD